MDLCGFGLPTKLISDDKDNNTFIEWTNEEKDMWLQWKKFINPQIRRYLLNENQLIIHGYIREVGLALNKQQIIPLKIIQLILFYFPIFDDLIICPQTDWRTPITLKADTINRYSMILIQKNAKLSVKPWNKYNLNGGKLIIKCDILILNEYSSIDVSGCGLSYDWITNNENINMKNEPISSDNIDNIINMNISVGQGRDQDAEKYGYSDYYYTFNNTTRLAQFKDRMFRGGGSIDIECRNQILMGHGSAIIANGKTGVDSGGDIRIICDELKMDKTAKIQAITGGKIIIGVNKSKELIATENIAPTPVLAQNINNKWVLLDENENDGDKEDAEDAYWDNYFKNNSFLGGNNKM